MKKRYLIALLSIIIIGYLAVKPIVSSEGGTLLKPYRSPDFYGIHLQKKLQETSLNSEETSKFWGIPNITVKGN